MKIKMLIDHSYGRVFCECGETYEIDDRTALAWIDKGIAEKARQYRRKASEEDE